MNAVPPPDPEGTAAAEEVPAEQWLRLAYEDLVAARVLLLEGSSARRIVCFLSQQAAEKALKAGLLAIDLNFPKIHGLTELVARFPEDRRPDLDLEQLDELDPWVMTAGTRPTYRMCLQKRLRACWKRPKRSWPRLPIWWKTASRLRHRRPAQTTPTQRLVLQQGPG